MISMKGYDYMTKKESFKEYGPNVRGYMTGSKDIKSKNAKIAKVPSNIVDPIVTNNIAWQEFDYTIDSQISTPKDKK